MSKKIIRPFGRIAKEIVIRCDDTGVIQVYPWNIDMKGNKTPMDPREMILGLQKITMDTCAAIFGDTVSGAMITPITEGSSDGPKANSHDNEGNPKR